MKGLTFSQPMMLAWLAGRKSVTRRLMKDQPNESRSGSNPFYLSGETVYIKETWATPVDDPDTKEIGLISYPASEKLLKGHWKIKSPRFMPEWASRSHALIANVRPERIQDVTEEEATKEGFARREHFIRYWDILHPESFNNNNWVWRYGLEKRP